MDKIAARNPQNVVRLQYLAASAQVKKTIEQNLSAFFPAPPFQPSFVISSDCPVGRRMDTNLTTMPECSQVSQKLYCVLLSIYVFFNKSEYCRSSHFCMSTSTQ